MPSGSFQPRREIKAVFLALAILVTGHTILGFAVADDPDPEAVLPGVFGTAAPRIGDIVAFEAVDEERGDPRPFFQFEWMGDSEILDSHGTAVRVHLARDLLLSQTPSRNQEFTSLFDALNHRLVATNVLYGQGESTSSDHLIPGFVEQSTEASESNQTTYVPSEGPRNHYQAPCGLYHHLQGAQHRTDTPIALFSGCRLDLRYDLAPDADDLFYAMRVDQVGDYDALVYAMRKQDDHTWHNVTAWMVADLPYPLRVEFSRETPYQRLEAGAITLVGYDEGHTPLDLTPPQGPDAPPLETRPVQPWGIDDRGIDHPFPLSEAWQRARDDPLYAMFREFLDNHPGAVTSSADYVEFSDDLVTTHRWTIRVESGPDHIEFCSYKREYASQGELLRIVPHSHAVPAYEAETCEWRGVGLGPAPPVTHLPTAGSLLARAQAYINAFGIEAQANAYGFWLNACVEDGPDPGCSWGGSHRHASSWTPEEAVPHLSNAQGWDTIRIATGHDGQTYDLTRSKSSQTNGVYPTAPPSAMAPPAETGASPLAFEATGIPGRELPPPRAIAGLGALAALAGALYYAWPTLMSLFTRVQPKRALDHPTRQRIEEMLRAEPGVHTKEIARRLAISRRAASHHLHQLQQVGLVVSRRSGRYTCHFLASDSDRRTLAGAAVLKAAGARRLLEAAAANPGASLKELARAAEITSATAHHHAERLAAADLLEKRREGRRVLHFATPGAGRLIGDDATKA